MKSTLAVLSPLLAALLMLLGAPARARPQGPDGSAVVLQESNNVGFLPYDYSYSTSNGIQREEQAFPDGDALQAQGRYTWTSPEGYTYTITYTAGRGGYHAKVPQLLPGPATPPGGPSGFPYAR